jgi:hypothetical protein
MIGCLFKYAVNTEFTQVMALVKDINTVSNYEQFFKLVFGDWHQYSMEIHRKLEAGVISAKLGLVNFDPNKKAPVKPTKKSLLDAAWEDNLPEDLRNLRDRQDRLADIARRLNADRPVNVMPEFRAAQLPPRPAPNLLDAARPLATQRIPIRNAGWTDEVYRANFGPRALQELLDRENWLRERMRPIRGAAVNEPRVLARMQPAVNRETE